MSNIGEALPAEMARVREIAVVYATLGPGGSRRR